MIGRPIHLQRTGFTSWGECGAQSSLQTLDWRAVECVRCRRTRRYRDIRTAARREEIDRLLVQSP